MKRRWQIGNIAALAFALLANFLVGAQLLNLPAISDISDKYASYLTPAGYAFSIWSLIYGLLVVFVVYQARDIFKPRQANDLPEKIGPWFIVASICNGLWTFVFVKEWVGLSVLILLLLSVSLYIILSRLNAAMYQPRLAVLAGVWWPMMIYAGWVTVASLVNIASWLESLGVTVTPTLAHIALVSLAAGLIALMVMRNVRELLLACIWGSVAIGVEQAQFEAGQSVATSAFTVAGVLLVAVVIHAYVNLRPIILSKLTS